MITPLRPMSSKKSAQELSVLFKLTTTWFGRSCSSLTPTARSGTWRVIAVEPCARDNMVVSPTRRMLLPPAAERRRMEATDMIRLAPQALSLLAGGKCAFTCREDSAAPDGSEESAALQWSMHAARTSNFLSNLQVRSFKSGGGDVIRRPQQPQQFPPR